MRAFIFSVSSHILFCLFARSVSLLLFAEVRNKEPISDHLYTEVCSWASSSSSFGFEFGNQSDSIKYQFETKVGTIIAATVQTYIDILVQMLKNGEDSNDEA